MSESTYDPSQAVNLIRYIMNNDMVAEPALAAALENSPEGRAIRSRLALYLGMCQSDGWSSLAVCDLSCMVEAIEHLASQALSSKVCYFEEALYLFDHNTLTTGRKLIEYIEDKLYLLWCEGVERDGWADRIQSDLQLKGRGRTNLYAQEGIEVMDCSVVLPP